MTLIRLVTKIGTVLAISVYADQRGPRYRQWRCWLEDETLRFTKPGWFMDSRVPVGIDYSLEGAMQDLVNDLRGGEIIRVGRELTEEDKGWRVPKNLEVGL